MLGSLFFVLLLSTANALQTSKDGRRTRAFETSMLLDDDFDEFVEEQLKHWHVPGMSLAVVDLELGLIEGKGYGYAALPDTRATIDTLYFPASTTKAFTAAVAGRIIEDELYSPGQRSQHISWTTPLKDLLPEFALGTEYSTFHTTFEDALSHRSGLPRHDFAYGWNNATLSDLVRTLKHLPMSAEPRARWQYCNTMYAVVGEALESLTGESLESQLRKLIWESLRMKSTTFSLKEARDLSEPKKSNNLARGYWFAGEDSCGDGPDNLDASDNSSEDKCHYVPEPYLNLTSLAGAGGIISSIRDYSSWVESLLEMSLDGGWMYRQLMTPRAIIPDDQLPSGRFMDPAHYALGWVVQWVGPTLFLYHGGGIPGFGTTVFLLPNEGFGFISMGNTEGTSASAGLMVFGELLKRKFGNSSMQAFIDEFATNLQQDVHAFSSLGPQIPKKRATEMQKRPPFDRNTNPPSPGYMNDLIGIYEHPAYGMININAHKSTSVSSRPIAFDNQQVPLTSSQNVENVTALLVTPSDRLLNWVAVLEPSSALYHYLDATIYCPRGPHKSDPLDFSDRKDCGKKGRSDRWLDCKDEIFWEEIFQNRAAVEFGLTGRVDRLGIEIEDEMVRQAFEDGGSANWRKGMIWFTRLH